MQNFPSTKCSESAKLEGQDKKEQVIVPKERDFLEGDLLGQKARLAQKDDAKFSHQMPPASYDLTSGCNNSTFVLSNLQGSNLPT